MQYLLQNFQKFYPPAAALPQRSLTVEGPVECISGGYDEETGPKYSWEGLERGDGIVELMQWTLSGRGILRYSNQDFELRAGQAFFVRIPHDHHYYYPVDGDEPWCFVYFMFRGAYSRAAWERLEADGPVRTLLPDTTTEHCMKDLLTCLREPLNRPSDNMERSMACINRWLYAGQSTQGSALLQRLQLKIDQYLASDLSVEQLAEWSGYSVFHFSRLFKEETGLSPAVHVRRVRMKRAAELLSSCDWTLERIAATVGLNDVNSFLRCFKREWGMTPGQYRKEGR